MTENFETPASRAPEEPVGFNNSQKEAYSGIEQFNSMKTSSQDTSNLPPLPVFDSQAGHIAPSATPDIKPLDAMKEAISAGAGEGFLAGQALKHGIPAVGMRMVGEFAKVGLKSMGGFAGTVASEAIRAHQEWNAMSESQRAERIAQQRQELKLDIPTRFSRQRPAW